MLVELLIFSDISDYENRFWLIWELSITRKFFLSKLSELLLNIRAVSDHWG